MLLFFAIAALITSALLGLAVLWLRRSAGTSLIETAKADYAVFVADLDARAAAGHLDENLAREEKAEAARTLLRASEVSTVAPPLHPLIGLGGVSVIGALALGLYLLVGQPDYGDQPYAARLNQWVAILERTPEALEPKPLAEALKTKVDEFSTMPEYWMTLGRNQVLAGDYYQGALSFRRAVALQPELAEGWSNMGEALTLMNREAVSPPEAQSAFEEALKRDPEDPSALYYTAKIYAADGNYPEARNRYDRLLSALPPTDARRDIVRQERDGLDAAERSDATTRTQIAGMVAGLEARLAATPDDPEGWARLLRSYRVLKDRAGEVRTLEAIDRIYQSRAETAQSILEQAQAPVGGE